MSGTLKFLLSAHVVFGLLGIIAFAAVGLWLLQRELPVRRLQKTALWGFILLLLSWASGGYYYAAHYGKAVRSIIKGGPYPWAHSIFMEAKEHVFLFLPFLALVIWSLLKAYDEQKLATSLFLKKELTILTGILVFLGIIITLAGAIISGAVR